MADKTLKIKVQADSQPLKSLNKELKAAKDELARLEQGGKKNSEAYKAQAEKVRGLTSELNKLNASAKEVSKSAQQSGKDFEAFGKQAGLAIAAIGVGLVAFGAKSLKLGADLNNLRSGFSGTAADLEMLRKATAGTVSEANLIALSNQAADLGVSMRDQILLFNLAEDAGDKYGGSVEENLQKIILATDGNNKGLRALGISVKDYEQKLKELEAVQGVKLEQLAADEQMNIRLQAIYDLTGVSIEDVKNKTMDAADTIENLGLIAETVASNFGSAFIKEFEKSIKSGQLFEGTLDGIGKTAENMGTRTADVLSRIGARLFELYQKYKEYSKWMNDNVPFLSNDGIYSTYLNQVVTGPPKTEPNWSKSGGDFLFGMGTLNLPTMPGGGITTSPGSKGGSTSKKAKETVEEIQMKVIEFSLEDLTRKIQDQTFLSNLKGVTATPGGTGNLFSEQKAFGAIDTEGALRDQQKQVLNDSFTIYDNVAKMMNLLGMGANNFVSSLLSGLTTAIEIIKTLQTINSILNIVPFLATGGSVTAGKPYIVGERGPELFIPNAGGQVVNNQQTMQMLSSMRAMSGGTVNVYIGGTLDGQKFLRSNFPQYESMRNYKRIN